MRKSQKSFVLIWLILIVSFNLIYNILFNNLSVEQSKSIYWLEIAFINAVFIVYLICSFRLFSAKSNQEYVYNFPAVYYLYYGMILNIVIGIVALYIKNNNKWIVEIVNIITFAYIIIRTIKLTRASEILVEIDQTISNKKDCFNDIVKKTENLYKEEENKKKRQLLKELYEYIRYNNSTSFDEEMCNDLFTYILELSKLDNVLDVEKKITDIKIYIKGRSLK